MPELPEVETVRRTIEASTGDPVTGLYASRLGLHQGTRIPAVRLRKAALGRSLTRWERRGKYLLGSIGESTQVLLVHLGMSGQLLLAPSKSPRPAHTHLELRFRSGGALRYVDPRRFGKVLLLAEGEREVAPSPLAGLGPEPLSRSFTAARLAERVGRSRRAIKAALLDQSVVAGIGNIYASEILFRARIDPRTDAGALEADALGRIVRETKRVLREAIDARGTSFSDYTDGHGEKGGYQHLVRVFGREGQPCRTCAAPIERFVQHGRSTFACLACQR